MDGEIALLSFRVSISWYHGVQKVDVLQPVAPLTAQEKQYLLELAEEQVDSLTGPIACCL